MMPRLVRKKQSPIVYPCADSFGIMYTMSQVRRGALAMEHSSDVKDGAGILEVGIDLK